MAARSALEYPRTMTVGGLRVCIRPVTPDDRERLLEGIRSMSVETSNRRFFTPKFYPSEETLHYLTHVDGEQHMALGAVDCTHEGFPGIGAARYVRLAEQPSVAEAAVVVLDAYQRRGIGSLLIAALSRYAAGHGIECFRGFVLAENRPFLAFLRNLGAFDERAHDGVMQIDVPVYDRAEALPDGPEIARARWAWRTLDEARVGECDEALSDG
jgi:GNAT superfamily N-acetyltransferase